MDDDVRFIELALGLQGQKLGIAGAGSDQGDAAGPALRAAVERGGKGRLERRRIAPEKTVAQRAEEEPPPEITARRTRLERGRHPGPKSDGPPGQGAETGRQHRLDLLADALAEDRGRTLGADGDHQRVAVDDGGGDDGGEVGAVDDIDRNAAGLRGGRYRRLERRVGSDEHQGRTVQHAGLEAGAEPGNGAMADQPVELGMEPVGDERHDCLRFEQQPDLAQGFLAAADHHHAALAHVEEHREIAHGCLLRQPARAGHGGRSRPPSK